MSRFAIAIGVWTLSSPFSRSQTAAPKPSAAKDEIVFEDPTQTIPIDRATLRTIVRQIDRKTLQLHVAPARENAEKKQPETFQIEGYDFYRDPVPSHFLEVKTDRVLDAFLKLKSHRPMNYAAKLCQFRPDFALVSQKQDVTVVVLICFTCAEWRATDGKAHYKSDIDDEILSELKDAKLQYLRQAGLPLVDTVDLITIPGPRR